MGSNIIPVALLVTLYVTLIPTGVTAFEWTNITCISGNAFKNFTSVRNGIPYNATETEACNGLPCINNVGCVDPRETPGEVFSVFIIMFLAGSFFFGFMGMKITSKKHFPIRLIFVNVSLALMMASTLALNGVLLVAGYATLAAAAFTGFIGIFITFLFFLLLMVKEFVPWMVNSIKNRNNDAEDYDVV